MIIGTDSKLRTGADINWRLCSIMTARWFSDSIKRITGQTLFNILGKNQCHCLNLTTSLY